MVIKTLFFGITTDYVNTSETTLHVEERTTVADFKIILKNTYPSLAKINSYAIAVNEVYAEDSLQLKSGDVLAVIPPVSGG